VTSDLPIGVREVVELLARVRARRLMQEQEKPRTALATRSASLRSEAVSVGQRSQQASSARSSLWPRSTESSRQLEAQPSAPATRLARQTAAERAAER
jgi:hypothetical protein